MNLADIFIGIDMELIARFKNLDTKQNKNFLSRVFTKNEVRYCLKKKDSAPHFAVRFCAKEAVIKALSSRGIHRVSYRDIEIINTAKGVPKVSVKSGHKLVQATISLSHTADYAIACAIVSYA